MDRLEELKRIYRTNTIIGGAIIGSIILFLVIVEVVRAKLRPFHGFVPVSSVQTLRLLFYGVAVLQIIVIRFLQPLLYKQAPSGDHKKLLMRLNTAALVTYFVAEIPAVLGLILFLLCGLSRDFYIFLFLSLILELMYFPRARNWEAWIQAKCLD
jgi:hypothetical protein